MYMLGRLRTASSPSRTVMALASYAGLSGLGALGALGALAVLALGAISGSGRFSGLTSDTVLLWLHAVVIWSARGPGTAIAVRRPGSGTGSGHTRRLAVPGASASFAAEHPPAPRQAGRRIVLQSTRRDRQDIAQEARQRHFPVNKPVVPSPPT